MRPRSASTEQPATSSSVLRSDETAVALDLGVPRGSEAGLERPAIVVTADPVLRAGPSVVQVVPVTTTLRGDGSEVTVEPDDVNGLNDTPAAQCQHIRAVATSRLGATSATLVPSFSRRCAAASLFCATCHALESSRPHPAKTGGSALVPVTRASGPRRARRRTSS